MKQAEIKVGGHYRAKVSRQLVTVRVDAIEDNPFGGAGDPSSHTAFHCTNLETGRKLVFRSAQKFREEVRQGPPVPRRKTVEAEAPTGTLPEADGPAPDDFTDYVDPTAPVVQSNLFTEYGEEVFNRPPTLWLYAKAVLEAGFTRDNLPPEDWEPGQPGPVSAPSPNAKSYISILRQPTDLKVEVLPPSSPSSKPLTGLGAKLLGPSKPVDNGRPSAPHLIIEARAGTGKTTTLIEGLRLLKTGHTTFIPSEQQEAIWQSLLLSKDRCKFVGFAAFNRSIANELKRRVPPGCDAMTMNGLGYKAVRRSFNLLPDDKAVNENRTTDIMEELTGLNLHQLRASKPTVLKAVRQLVNLAKTNLLGYIPGEPALSCDWPLELDRIAHHYEVELEDERGGKDRSDEIFDLVPRVLERCRDVERDGCVDYADQLWLPVVLGLRVFRYDVLLVDEAQDMNRCQHALARMAGERLILCGDPRQAIYGFAGADNESMKRLAAELGAESRQCLTLPLTVTRRCGKAIVTEANRIVKEFTAFESNPEGKITTGVYPFYVVDGQRMERPFENTYLAQVQPNDMVLCRVNAPLVSQCLSFIKRGIRAKIMGRNVGQSLINLINQLEVATVEELVGKVDNWSRLEVAKEQVRRHPNEAKIINIHDRAECLRGFTEGSTTLQEVKDKIDKIFTDDEAAPAIRLSSIHKAKGLEARRVFLLRPEGAGCPHPAAKSTWQQEQEMNLLYVAITRAIEELVYVS